VPGFFREVAQVLAHPTSDFFFILGMLTFYVGVEGLVCVLVSAIQGSCGV
jgi:hypothetical protein